MRQTTECMTKVRSFVAACMRLPGNIACTSRKCSTSASLLACSMNMASCKDCGPGAMCNARCRRVSRGAGSYTGTIGATSAADRATVGVATGFARTGCSSGVGILRGWLSGAGSREVEARAGAGGMMKSPSRMGRSRGGRSVASVPNQYVGT